MKIYTLGLISPRYFSISGATNANPIVITTSAAHGFNQQTDTVTITGITGNTNANGTYGPGAYTTPTSTTITLTGVAGNGTFGGTATASAPQQIIASANFSLPNGYPGTAQAFQVCKILFTPAPSGTASLYVGTSILNQKTLNGVMRVINPPPVSGIIDYFELDADSTDIIPLSDYWIDAAKPGTEGVIVTYWLR